jgi:UDP-N-acetylglucosamine acyltransferase
MATTHVGHDCHIGSNNVFANGATVAGHVILGDDIIVGGLVGIHQFVKIGNYSMIAAGSMVNKDIPPYTISQGDRAELVGINQIGLERHQFTSDEIQEIKNAFKHLFLSKNGNFQDRLTDFENSIKENKKNLSETQKNKLIYLLKFIQESERGIAPTRRK